MLKLVYTMITLFIAPAPRHPLNKDVYARQEMAHQITDAATRYEIDPAVLTTRIFLESTFRSNVVGAAGEVGLSQIKHDWDCRAIGLYPKAIPYDNIMCAAYKLKKYVQKCGSYQRALSHYITGKCGSKHGNKKGRYTVRLARRMEIKINSSSTNQEQE